MRFPRTSGILLHLTSLPGGHGIGDMGEAAYRFVDFLQRSGQSIWQVLPLGPTAFGDSPYSSYSAFAGNSLLISLTALAEEGLLAESDLESLNCEVTDRVDFETVRKQKSELLKKAFESFQTHSRSAAYDVFCEQNAWWLTDFARFTAFSKQFGHSDWSNWEAPVAQRDEVALQEWDAKLAHDLDYAKFLQFVFYSQWKQLRAYANERGVKIFGDMPIFVGYDSADVWANQNLFFLDEQGKQTVVAGVPPDYFSETGQRWGNPLYRWDSIADTNYAWWTNRFRHAFEHFDLMRIDHFRGFEAYWEVQADCPTAIDGQWQSGPGASPFQAAQTELGELPIVAEDLGLITDKVHHLRDELNFPGMRVFQFGFDNEADPYHRPEAYPDHSVAYTGTHDNETIVGWFRTRKVTRAENDQHDDPLLDPVVAADSSAPHLDIIRSVFRSPAEIAIVPMQDLLGLDNDSRMNTPGEASGNWGWRCLPEHLCDAVTEELVAITDESSRRADAVVAV